MIIEKCFYDKLDHGKYIKNSYRMRNLLPKVKTEEMHRIAIKKYTRLMPEAMF